MTKQLRNTLTVRITLAVVGTIGVLLISALVFFKLSLSSVGASYTVYDGCELSIWASNDRLIDLPVKPYERTVEQCQPPVDDVINILEKHGFTRIGVFPDLSPVSYPDACKTYRGETYCLERRLSNSWPVYVTITDGPVGEGYAVWFFYSTGWIWAWDVDRSAKEAAALGNSLARDIAFRLMGWEEE